MSNAPSSIGSLQEQGRKYLRLFVASMKGISWPTVSIAFFLAVALWYTVTVRDKVETWVDVNVQFKGAPANLVISEGLINKLSVRVRVARGLSRGLTGRDASMVVDLSPIVRGSNTIVITREMLPFTSAYEVVEVSPPRILVVADTMATKEIDLEARVEGKLATDYYVESLLLNPSKVTISGAESQISSISRLSLPVLLTPELGKGNNSLTAVVPVPLLVKVAPAQIGIDVLVDIRTKRLKLARRVVPAGEVGEHTPAIVPDTVTLIVNMPESLVRYKEVLDKITATVSPPQNLGADSHTLAVSVNLPDNAELVSVTPAEVTVSVPESVDTLAQ